VATIEMAPAGLGLNPAAGLDCICDLIGLEDPQDADYDQNVEGLLRLAACIWSLRHSLLSPASASGASVAPQIAGLSFGHPQLRVEHARRRQASSLGSFCALMDCNCPLSERLNRIPNARFDCPAGTWVQGVQRSARTQHMPLVLRRQPHRQFMPPGSARQDRASRAPDGGKRL